jgi:hypothetical protein
MSKKYGYGEKAVHVMELLNSTNKSDHQIAYAVGCHVSYVKALRRKMAHKAEEPQSPDIQKMIDDWRHEADTDVDAILNERASTYGNFIDVARMAQRLKNVAHTAAGDQGKSFAADQAEALDMIFSKLARIINGDSNHTDSWIDIAGYAKLVADRLQGNVR